MTCDNGSPKIISVISFSFNNNGVFINHFDLNLGKTLNDIEGIMGGQPKNIDLQTL